MDFAAWPDAGLLGGEGGGDHVSPSSPASDTSFSDCLDVRDDSTPPMGSTTAADMVSAAVSSLTSLGAAEDSVGVSGASWSGASGSFFLLCLSEPGD